MQVRKYKDARTGMWYVRYWRDGKAFTETTGVKDKGLAEKIRGEKENDIVLNRFGFAQQVMQALADPAQHKAILEAIKPKDPILLDKALDEFVRLEHEPNNSSDHVDNVRNQIRRFLAHTPVRHVHEVEPNHVAEYLAKCKKDGDSDKTRRDKFFHMNAFFRWLVRGKRVLASNPCEGVQRPPVGGSDAETAYFTASEVEILLREVVGSPLEDIITAALYTGIRRAELFRQQGEDVDLDARVIRIRAGSAKTKYRRWTPVFDQALPTFMKLPRKGPIFPFTGSGWFERELEKVMKKAGLTGGFREFRRTWATHVLLNGVEPYVAARWGGHDVRVQQDHYAGLRPGDKPLVMTWRGMRLVRHGLPDVPRTGQTGTM